MQGFKVMAAKITIIMTTRVSSIHYPSHVQLSTMVAMMGSKGHSAI